MILALYGAGSMGREFRYLAEETGEWSRVVFIDDNTLQETVAGCPVYRFQPFRKAFSPGEVRFVVAIGEPKHRKEAYERLTLAGYTGGRLIHPSARVFPDAEIGEGSAICPDAYIGSLARLGKNTYISRGASVGHDTVVGNHTRLGVNAFTGGHTVIGDNAFIGANACLRDRITVGSGSIVALGAVVFEDVPEGITVIGNPARPSGDGAASPVYLSALPAAPTESLPEKPAENYSFRTLRSAYWEVFSACFEGVDFNPVTYQFHEPGWDSVAQMALISRLEEAFSISFRGRESLKLRSYTAGLDMVRKKLEEAGKLADE